MKKPSRNSREKRQIKIKLARKRGQRCYICGEHFNLDQLTIDHFIPLADGGTWDMSNLKLACRRCNQNKADTNPMGLYQER